MKAIITRRLIDCILVSKLVRTSSGRRWPWPSVRDRGSVPSPPPGLWAGAASPRWSQEADILAIQRGPIVGRLDGAALLTGKICRRGSPARRTGPWQSTTERLGSCPRRQLHHVAGDEPRERTSRAAPSRQSNRHARRRDHRLQAGRRRFGFRLRQIGSETPSVTISIIVIIARSSSSSVRYEPRRASSQDHQRVHHGGSSSSLQPAMVLRRRRHRNRKFRAFGFRSFQTVGGAVQLGGDRRIARSRVDSTSSGERGTSPRPFPDLHEPARKTAVGRLMVDSTVAPGRPSSVVCAALLMISNTIS